MATIKHNLRDNVIDNYVIIYVIQTLFGIWNGSTFLCNFPNVNKKYVETTETKTFFTS